MVAVMTTADSTTNTVQGDRAAFTAELARRRADAAPGAIVDMTTWFEARAAARARAVGHPCAR